MLLSVMILLFDVSDMFGFPTVTNIPDVARAPANVAVYHDPVVSDAAVDLAVVDVLSAVVAPEL
jgi:hypothetical protein